MRFCCGFAFGSRLLFVLRQTGRLAAACVSVPPGRDRHLCVLAVLFDYLPLWVHFGFGRFLQAISTGYRGCGGRGNGVTGLAARPLCVFAQSHWLCNAFRGEYAGAARPRLRQRVFDSLDSLHAAAGLRWCGFAAFVRFCAAALALLRFPRGVRWGSAPQTAPKSLRLSGLSSGAGRVRKCALRGGAVLVRIRSACASLRNRIGFVMLSAGSTLGAPDCAKESSTLWTLLTLRRGRVNAYTRRRHPGTRKDPPGSNLWPGGSGCIKMLSTRSNIQTRAAPKRRGVGLQRAKRCACRLSLPRACRRG